MTERVSLYRRKLLLLAAGWMAVAVPIVMATSIQAQSPTQAQSPMATGANLKFDVASVKQNKIGGDPDSNFLLYGGAAEASTPSSGLFSAHNQPLIQYISFAYNLTSGQFQSLMSKMPGWLLTDRFDIQARANGNYTKDEMRLMLRSLLADRFKLAIHIETQEQPIFALRVIKPGKTGPELQPFQKDSECSTDPEDYVAPTKSSSIGVGHLPKDFPCGRIVSIPRTGLGLFHIGGRNVTIGFLTNSFQVIGNLGRPVIDQTGLNGTYDFTLEWLPDYPSSAYSGGGEVPSGPAFEEAVKEQLGLMLVSIKGPVETLVLDHIERPSEN